MNYYPPSLLYIFIRWLLLFAV